MNRELLAVLIFCSFFPAVASGQTSSPAMGAPERHAIMEAMRPRAETIYGGPVIFKVKTLRVSNGYAYAEVEPERPDGTPYRIRRPDWMNAYADALLERGGAQSVLLEFRNGPGDVGYCDRADIPKSLIPDCQ